MGKSIGSLYIDIIARTEKLEQDVERVKSKVSSLEDSTKKAGSAAQSAFKSFQLFNSFQGRGMTGITLDMMSFMLVLQAVKREIQFVYDNIEKIPGIPAEAVQNVNEFKAALKDARNVIDGIIATGMSWGIQFAKMVGTGLGEFIYGEQEIKVELVALDKLRAASDPGYYDKVRAAIVKLSEARKAEAVATENQADRVVELRKQAQLYLTHAGTAGAGTIDTLTKIQDETKAFELQAEAARIVTNMRKHLITLRREEDIENERGNMVEMSQLQRITELRKKVAEESSFVNIRTPSTKYDPLSPKELESLLEHYPKLLKYTAMLRGELQQLKTPAMEFRDAFVGGFNEMATVATQFLTGLDTDFNKVLKSITDKIIETFIKLAIINPILNAMFGDTKGFQLLPALFGSGKTGKASGGPGSGWTMVGEQGAELVNLPGGSNVIPAWKTRQMLGSSSGGNVYQIDARGADPSVVPRLQQMILSLAGPGVTEQRSFAASQNYSWRNRK